jgi:hypothetical protein
MSVIQGSAGTPSAHVIRNYVKGVTARFRGIEGRGQDLQVRRNSYDREDPRAKVFRPIADGTIAGALGWIDCLLKTVSEWDDHHRRKGGGRPLGFAGLRVLEALLGRRGGIPVDFKTGQLDPAILTIARVARLSHTTVVRALQGLKRLGLLRWVRRTERSDNAGGYGPQRRQISNAYWFDVTSLPARVLQTFRDRCARKQLHRTQTAPARPQQAEPGVESIKDPELRAALDRLGRKVNAIPPDGQYPGPGEDQKE